MTPFTDPVSAIAAAAPVYAGNVPKATSGTYGSVIVTAQNKSAFPASVVAGPCSGWRKKRLRKGTENPPVASGITAALRAPAGIEGRMSACIADVSERLLVSTAFWTMSIRSGLRASPMDAFRAFETSPPVCAKTCASTSRSGSEYALCESTIAQTPTISGRLRPQKSAPSWFSASIVVSVPCD